MCQWVIDAALAAQKVSAVYVSTESIDIANIVRSISPEIYILQRPKNLAMDETPTESVMAHFAQKIEFDNLITMQATSPLTKSSHLDDAITMFERNKLDSLLTAVRSKRFFWNEDGTAMNYNPSERPRRQEFRGTLMENGAFYITRRAVFEGTGQRLAGKVGIYEMPVETAIELDEEFDWFCLNHLLRGQYED